MDGSDQRSNRSIVFPPPLADKRVRDALQHCILANEAGAFCEALNLYMPEYSSGHRLYGVLHMKDSRMEPILVNEFGRRLGPGDVLEPTTPIHLLNVEFDEKEVRVDSGEGYWKISREAFERAVPVNIVRGY